MAGLLLVAVVVLVAVLAGRGGGPAAAPTGGTGATTSATATATESPEPSASPTASATPTPAPEASVPTETPGAGASAAPGAAAPLDLAPAEAAVVDDVREIESSAQHTDPVAPGTAVAPVEGVQVVVDSADRVEATARGPGEVAGPALAVTLTVTNATASAVVLDDVVLNLYGADGVPGSQNLGDDRSAPLAGELAPGASATGTYVLTLPQVTGDSYVLSVSVTPTSPVVLVVITPEAG
ncbi:hypothetical protein [Cellulomonas marina]|uniref:hypothetical protein n=1 Tax=Cellulomonas marina TaxID=988821 RepID=UPI001587C0AA|nr:hypothetical protein [Cellulomonas marina]